MKLFTAQIVAGYSLLSPSQFALNDHLRGYACVVHCLPATGFRPCMRLLAVRVSLMVCWKGVPHLQAAGHIQVGGIAMLIRLALAAGAEVAFRFPVVVPLALEFSGEVFSMGFLLVDRIC